MSLEKKFCYLSCEALTIYLEGVTGEKTKWPPTPVVVTEMTLLLPESTSSTLTPSGPSASPELTT